MSDFDKKCEKSKDRDCEALSGAMEDRKCEKSMDRDCESLSGAMEDRKCEKARIGNVKL